MPDTVTLPKTEYDRLRTIETKFELARKLLELEFFAPPPTRNTRKVLREFRATGRYNAAFLKSLARGLKESNYFTTR